VNGGVVAHPEGLSVLLGAPRAGLFRYEVQADGVLSEHELEVRLSSDAEVEEHGRILGDPLRRDTRWVRRLHWSRLGLHEMGFAWEYMLAGQPQFREAPLSPPRLLLPAQASVGDRWEEVFSTSRQGSSRTIESSVSSVITEITAATQWNPLDSLIAVREERHDSDLQLPSPVADDAREDSVTLRFAAPVRVTITERIYQVSRSLLVSETERTPGTDTIIQRRLMHG
jgi:hypothetical protein